MFVQRLRIDCRALSSFTAICFLCFARHIRRRHFGLVNKFMQSSTATRCNIDGADMSTLTVSYPPHGCMIYSVALENAHTPCVHTLEKGHVRKGGESCTHLSSFWAVPAKPEQAHVLTLGTTLMASSSPQLSSYLTCGLQKASYLVKN